jgi:hypothetical protein
VSSDPGVAFRSTADPPALVVLDRASATRYEVACSEPPAPAPTPADTTFPAPVDEAVSVDTDRLRVHSGVSTIVRDAGGDWVTGVDYGERVTVGGGDGDVATAGDARPAATDRDGPDGHCYLELGTPVKTYLRVESPFTVARSTSDVTVTFDRRATVRVGARAKRRRPTAHVMTTADPHDVMRAVSLFGTALATHSPERSFPTLRDAPPALSVGERFDADGLTPPATGVTVETPPRLETILPVAPLAYYLGARIVPGDTFAVRADGRTEDYGVGDADGVAAAAREVLERTFVLDCAVRPAGLYPVAFDPTSTLEPAIEAAGWSLSEVYDRSLAGRVATALSLPADPIAAAAPEWPRVAVVEPRASSLAALPAVVADLGPVRAASPPRISGPRAMGRLAASVARPAGESTRSVKLVADGDARYVDLTDERATGPGRASTPPSDPDPDPATAAATGRAPGETGGDRPDPGLDTVVRRHTWVGEDIPIGADQFLATAADNLWAAESVAADPPLDVVVVCNESRMDEELAAVERSYDGRGDLPVDVTAHRRLAPDDLRRVLSGDADLVHYVGHATPDGLRCADGRTLDTATVDSTDVTAVCLNACQSYAQGRNLIEAGAVGAVLTHGNVDSDQAHEVGAALSRLVTVGVPLASAVDCIAETTPVAGGYTTIGVDLLSVGHPGPGPPAIWRVTPAAGTDATDGSGPTDGEYTVRIQSLCAPVFENAPGAFNRYAFTDDNTAHLLPDTVGPYRATRSELHDVLDGDVPVPIVYDGRLRWPGDGIREEL